ncbi:glycoside hydrolase family 3 N-terminal domain-containing protein [uncultured Sphingorhabdus sp.]|uniref:glycoside hydrolase family 3 N-terminal domain-containing protein n=1 Tax=uncultured Sphingorhabdus sp. TaxID=1686106 RepID=UPI0026109963|nr:glycoside hydrolase family 3 N-terminal domain-containing protein [uncultured Sphingorhabdus sp.]HMS18998.1 glycoside hydrolase family 3 N-terminal domain-containing protein [Sphingorhabdus sp.]
MVNSPEQLDLRTKVGQLFFIGIAGPELDASTRELIEDFRPGGICLFARNIREAKQTRELLDGIREMSQLVPFLSLDQEGGLVDRLRRILTPMPAANKIRTVEEARRLASLIAESTRLLGFNTDFAPVVDVIDAAREKDNNGLYSRAFGSNAEGATELAGAFLDKLQSEGILGCIKHFPGLGAAAVDSHEELPSVEIDDNELSNTDLLPYRKLTATHDPAFVMVAHAAFPNSKNQISDLDGRMTPSSLNGKFVTELLRDEFNYEGISITDDLEMGAILKNYGIGKACVKAVNAGEDMLAICAGRDNIIEGRDAVIGAVERGEIAMERVDEAVARIERGRQRLSPPLEFNAERLAELSDEIAEFNQHLNR